VHPDLEALLTLQRKDEAVRDTDARLAALEPELARLDQALAGVEHKLEQARRGIQDAVGRRGELEGKIATYRGMQEARKQRLEWVKGAKEAQTLMAELDLARTVIAKEEVEFLRSGDAVTEAEVKAAEAEKGVEEVREAQRVDREIIDGKRQAIMADREQAIVERERAAKLVRASLLSRYEKIRKGKAPVAVYPLHGGSCGHCFTAVPTQRKVLIQRGLTIEGCEACGVLLYVAG
jgi:predicted  nucleic acid-binding Zn-ribbon protein